MLFIELFYKGSDYNMLIIFLILLCLSYILFFALFKSAGKADEKMEEIRKAEKYKK
jgi:hypothetical protein